MVADSLTQTRPKKPQGFQIRIPLSQKLQIRALYLVHQLSSKEIAAKTKLSERSIHNLCHREKWTQLRKSQAKRMEEKSLARNIEQLEEIHEAVAVTTEELSLGTGDAAREALTARNAKDLQAYSQALKNLYGVAREARGMNQQAKDAKQGVTVVFLGDLPRVERRAEKVIEVRADPQPIPSTSALPLPSPKEAPISSGAIEDTGSGVAQPMD